MAELQTYLQLQSYINQHHINAKIQCFEQDCSNSENCIKAVGLGMDHFIKTIILLDDTGKTYAIILRADQKIDRKKLKLELKVHDLQLATAEHILTISGYPLGGVPPFGFRVEFIIDQHLLEQREIKFYAGGGSTNALVKITPNEIMRVTQAQVLNCSKLSKKA